MNDKPEEKIQKPGDDQLKFKNNRELLLFLFIAIRENRKWWLLPLLFVLAILSVFVSLTGNTTLLPAIYALF
ncbi:MAG TPA: DUF5989 family protein [bacterium]|nr:DUF5989 family protein [bacterium]